MDSEKSFKRRDGDLTKQSGAKKKILLNSTVVWIQSYPSPLQNNLKGTQLNMDYTQIYFCHLQGEAARCTFSSCPRCGGTDVSLPVPQRRHLELWDSHCYAWHSSAGRPRRGSGSSSSGAWHWVPSQRIKQQIKEYCEGEFKQVVWAFSASFRDCDFRRISLKGRNGDKIVGACSEMAYK